MVDLSSFTFVLQLVGAVLTVFGGLLCLRWWVFWRRNYRGDLLTGGPYARVRHPFYSAFMLLVVGLAVLAPFLETIMLAVVSIPVLVFYVGREEEWLVKRYGRAYREYMAMVRWRLVPNVY